MGNDQRQRLVTVDGPPGTSQVAQAIHAVAAAWVLSLGFDVFLHGGVLARLYFEPSPFLLSPTAAFRRIPLGYLAFLILTLALYWLFRQMGIRGARSGFRVGAVSGIVVWGAFAMGLYSISTISLPLLAGWWIGQAIELAMAGAVLGAVIGGVSKKRIWLFIIATVVVFVALTVILQSVGWAPPMKIVR